MTSSESSLPLRVPFAAPGGVLFEKAVEVVATLREAGHEAYLVGGSIRDMVMGQPPKDFDITTSAEPAQVQALFKQTVPVGIEFGTVMVLIGKEPFEVTTFRIDGDYEDGRRPNSVSFATVEQDVERRDFTINGLLYDPLDEVLIDYPGGLDDIKSEVLRTIGEPMARFGEDRLRMMRAVRFASRFAFTLDEATQDAIRSMASRIVEVSAERIQQELLKTLDGPRPSLGMALLEELGLLPHIAPQLTPDPALIERAKRVEEYAYSVDASLMLTAWSIASTRPQVEAWLASLKLSRAQQQSVLAAWDLCHALSGYAEMTVAARKRWQRAAETSIAFPVAVSLPDADAHIGLQQALSDRARWDNAALHPPRLLSGHDLMALGVPPGPTIGRAVKALEDAQLEGRCDDRAQAEAWITKYFVEGRTSHDG